MTALDMAGVSITLLPVAQTDLPLYGFICFCFSFFFLVCIHYLCSNSYTGSICQLSLLDGPTPSRDDPMDLSTLRWNKSILRRVRATYPLILFLLNMFYSSLFRFVFFLYSFILMINIQINTRLMRKQRHTMTHALRSSLSSSLLQPTPSSQTKTS